LIKGIYHIHSNFSYDGNNSVEEITAWAHGNHIDFVILTEHIQGFSDKKFESYFEDCARASQNCMIIPGLEYSLKISGREVHMGVFGVSSYLAPKRDYDNIQSFLEKVHELGGIAILNHPDDLKELIYDNQINKFDLIEIWNTKYGYRYAPQFTLMRTLARSNYTNSYIASSDTHKIPTNDYVVININNIPGEEISEKHIISQLERGNFSMSYGQWEILPSGTISGSSFYHTLLPYLASLHKLFYGCLQSFARAINFKPPKQLTNLLKLKFR
jgi:predicted metal-dependent phosphoesterase TrpH